MRYIKKTNSLSSNKVLKTLWNTPSQNHPKEAALTQKKSSDPPISSTDWLKDIIDSGTMVRIDWVDAQTSGGPGWVEAEDMQQWAFDKCVLVTTIGFVLNETDNSISLTDAIQHDGTAGGSVHTIPKEMIKSVHELGILMETEDDDNGTA